ncbi:MAG TPA: DUF484 family protein [Pseudomonadales bacterium]
MSSAIEPDNPAASLSDDVIVGYLRGNPDFFQRHAGLLSELNLPHDSGHAVSLIERQVAILRERNMQMRRRMNELLQTGKENDELFAKTRTLTLELLNVDTWHELNEVLATYVLADFNADFVCCHLVGLPVHLDHLVSHEAEPPYERFAPSSVPVCTMLRAEDMGRLFPAESHENDGSAVLAPLGWEHGEGCLAVGSRQTNRFTSDMDTLFVTYIGEVLGRVIQRLAS